MEARKSAQATHEDATDSDLLRSFCSGDESAFTAIYHRHIGLAYGVARRRTGQMELAEEAAQNAMAVLAKKARALRSHTNLPGWIHRTAILEANTIMRRHQRHEERHLPLEAMSNHDRQLTDPLNAIPDLDDALDKLTEPERAYLFQRFYQGLTAQDVAALTGESEAALQKRGHRALEKLAGLLESKFGRGIAISTVAASLAENLPAIPPPGVLQHGATTALQAGSVNSSTSTAVPWSIVNGVLAIAMVSGVLWQETLIAQRDHDASLAARSPVKAEPKSILATSKRTRPSPFAVPKSLFEDDPPDLATLSKLAYRQSLHTLDPTNMKRLREWIWRQSDDRAQQILSGLLEDDTIPRVHRLELATQILDLRSMSPTEEAPHTQNHLEWIIAVHEALEPGIQWHSSLTSTVRRQVRFWAKKDVEGCWHWLQQTIEEGKLGGTAADNVYTDASYPIQAALNAVFEAAYSQGNTPLSEQLFNRMNVAERSEALMNLLWSTRPDSPEWEWLLDATMALPSAHLRKDTLRGIAANKIKPESIPSILAKWEAELETKAEFARMACRAENLPALLDLDQLTPDIAKAVFQNVAKNPFVIHGYDWPALMKVAENRTMDTLFVEAVLGSALDNLSDRSIAQVLAEVLATSPESQTSQRALSDWQGAIDANKDVSLESLLASGLSEEAAKILFP